MEPLFVFDKVIVWHNEKGDIKYTDNPLPGLKPLKMIEDKKE